MSRAALASTGTTRTGDGDPLKTAVELLVAVFKADFGEQWRKQFGSDAARGSEDLRLWKRRAYAKLRGVEPGVIVDGYERCVNERRPYMPNLSDLTETIVQLDRQRKRQAEEITRVSGPPRQFQGGMAGYVAQVLTPEAQTRVAQRELARMREILSRSAGTEVERSAGEAKVKDHEALLRQQREAGLIRTPHAYRAELKCAANVCQRIGTVSTSISGGGLWYCAEHARAHRTAGSL